MPRDIPVGNRKLLVCFDSDFRIRDIYFPHVGQEDHVGAPCRFGLWVDGLFAWVGTGGGWKLDLNYETDTLVTRVTVYHPERKVLLVCNDAVDFHENVFLRRVTVENLSPEAREIRLFLHQNFDISGNSVGDTAALDPETGAMVHYKRNRYFLASGMISAGSGLFQVAAGQRGVMGKEGTFRDAEDGWLSGNPIAQGSVDSVISLSLRVGGNSQENAYFWLAAGEDWGEIRRLDALVRHKGVDALIARTADYWRLWVHKETPALEHLPQAAAEEYRRSLLVLSTQIDAEGGILAANDSDVIQFNRDTYSYVWPRDGALVANAMDLAGYPEAANNFYRFVSGLITPGGYLLHKYNPDGSLASSWHPWFQDGRAELPIQEDETALVIWALWNHFVLYRDIDMIKPLYRPLLKRAADFLCDYRDAHTGLPDASWDLWEERRGIFSYTVGAVFGGLTAASLFCSIFGETERAERYRRAAAEIRDAASTHLWRPELGRFCRMITVREGAVTVDGTLDASLWGLFAFGLYSAEDPRIQATMTALKEALWIKTPVGGLARYEGDEYHRASRDVPGNPWFVCSLWFADYVISSARTEQDLQPAADILAWATGKALPSGVMPEQLHPFTGKPLSVSPLTWSHAAFVATCQHFLRRLEKMKVCPECGLPVIFQRRQEDWLEKLFGEACDTIRGICRVK